MGSSPGSPYSPYRLLPILATPHTHAVIKLEKLVGEMFSGPQQLEAIFNGRKEVGEDI
jgi:hypothetical protein